MPEGLFLLPHLQHLLLDKNALEALPCCPWRLPLLQRLQLAHNRLVTLPPSVSTLTSLVVRTNTPHFSPFTAAFAAPPGFSPTTL